MATWCREAACRFCVLTWALVAGGLAQQLSGSGSKPGAQIWRSLLRHHVPLLLMIPLR